MAEKRAEPEQAEEEEDYMGDLSLFLPPESISKPSIPSKKVLKLALFFLSSSQTPKTLISLLNLFFCRSRTMLMLLKP